MRDIDSIQESLTFGTWRISIFVADKDKVLADAQRQAENFVDQTELHYKLTAESELACKQEQANPNY